MKINIIFDTGFIVECYVQEPLCFSSLMAKLKDIAPTLQDFNLLWKDEDGDMITFSSQEELNEAINGELEKIDIYIQGLRDTMSSQQDRTPPPAEEKPKTFISPECLPDILSEINITRKLKRRFRRCGRKRSSRHRIPAANCYPTKQTSRCKRRQKDISKSLAAMCISENNL